MSVEQRLASAGRAARQATEGLSAELPQRFGGVPAVGPSPARVRSHPFWSRHRGLVLVGVMAAILALMVIAGGIRMNLSQHPIPPVHEPTIVGPPAAELRGAPFQGTELRCPSGFNLITADWDQRSRRYAAIGPGHGRVTSYVVCIYHFGKLGRSRPVIVTPQDGQEFLRLDAALRRPDVTRDGLCPRNTPTYAAIFVTTPKGIWRVHLPQDRCFNTQRPLVSWLSDMSAGLHGQA